MSEGELRHRPNARPAGDGEHEAAESSMNRSRGAKEVRNGEIEEAESLSNTGGDAKEQDNDSNEKEVKEEAQKAKEETVEFLLFFRQKKYPFSWWRLARSFMLLIPALILGWAVNPYFAVVNPAAYYPADIPLPEGIYAPNDILLNAKKFASGLLPGAQDIIFAPDGTILCGSLDGWIRSVSPDQKVEDYIQIGTPVLGLAWAPNGDLIVCAGDKGLLSVNKDKEVEVLSSEANGRRFKMVNSAVVASDGFIYFTDGSDNFTHAQSHLEGLDMGLHGRLLIFSPRSKRTETVVDSIALAAGVAMAREEDFLLVADAFRYRVLRYWLKGPKQGRGDFFVDNLPGYPGKISSNPDGSFWLALPARRSLNLDYLQQLPLLKTAFSHLPASQWWKPARGGWVLRINEKGDVIESLEDSEGKMVNHITSVRQHGSALYFSGAESDFIGILDLA